ncbi:MAG TPA: TolC family protein, partial [Gemmatimonadales bacterium]|nr:TolC family protein [Gemmatimonadales bacterium]
LGAGRGGTLAGIMGFRKLACALALAAGVGPMAARAAAQTPAQNHAGDTTVAAGDTATGARQLSLDEALRLAGASSEDIGIARAEAERAEGARQSARSLYFPQLAASVNYTRTLRSQFRSLEGADTTTSTPGPPAPVSCPVFTPNPSLPVTARLDSLEQAVVCASSVNPFAGFQNLPFGRPNQYSVGLAFSQQVFNLRTIGQSEAASAQLRGARIGVASTEAQLMLDVTQAYYDAVLSDRLVQIAEATLEQADTTLSQAQLAKQVGNQSEFELLQARVTRDNQRPVVIQRHADRELAYLRLKQLLNVPLEQTVALTTTLGDSAATSGLPAQVASFTAAAPNADTSAEARAPVRQADEAVAAQRGLLKASTGQRWPAISLTSNFSEIAYPASGIPSTGDFLTDWSVAVSLSVPIFVGGRIGGDVHSARAGLASAEQRLHQTRQLARLDSRTAETQLAAALAAWEASEGTGEQASRAYQIAEIRYREGISTQTELSDSRIQLQQAEANRARAARDLKVARTRVALLPYLPLANVPSTAAGAAAQATQSAQPLEIGPAPAPTPNPSAPAGTRPAIQAGVASP